MAEKNEVVKNNKHYDRWIYPIESLGGGIYKAYFSTYISLLMTSVYTFSIVLSGALESINAIVGWVAAPVFAVIIGKTKFKKGKYWPWYIIGGVGTGVAYIIIFSLPVFSSNPSGLAPIVAVFIVLASFLASCSTQVSVTVFQKTSKNGQERARQSSLSKITRDGCKFVVGLLFPIMLASFTTMFNGSEVKSWALVAVILAGAAIVIYFITSLVLCKGSQLEIDELNNIQENSDAPKKKGSFIVTLKSIFANKPLLSIFVAFVLSKMVYFYHIMGGSYFWKYFMGDFTKMSFFSTSFTIMALLGAAATPYILKLIKDTKKTFVIVYILQVVCYAAAYFVFGADHVTGVLVIFGFLGFFNGICDSLILPLFGAAVDYGEWKYGKSDPGLAMSTYSVSVKVASFAATASRTAILAAAGFNSKTISEFVPDTVKLALKNLNSLYPLIISVVIILLLLIFYPISDEKLKVMRKECDERNAQA